MKQWIKFTKEDQGYFDPRNENNISNISGLRNRPNVDPFTHSGTNYPIICNTEPEIIINWQEGETNLMLLFDEDEAKINTIVAGGFSAVEIAEENILSELINNVGLPADTTLDENLEPLFPDL